MVEPAVLSSPLCLVLLVGLPGSGKTTFAKSLKDVLKQFTVVHIEVDTLERELKAKSPAKEGFSADTWKEAREAAFDAVSELAKSGAKTPTAVVVDDNLYYASMRKPYLQLARRAGLGLVQVVFRAGTAKAKELNAGRTGEARVEDKVIERMGEKIEFPDEKGQCGVVAAPEDVEKAVAEAVKNPLEDTAAKMAERKELDREETARSLVHQIDLGLRQEVGAVFKEIGKEKARMKGKAISRAKEEFLERVHMAAKGAKEENGIRELLQIEAGDDMTAVVANIVSLFRASIKSIVT